MTGVAIALAPVNRDTAALHRYRSLGESGLIRAYRLARRFAGGRDRRCRTREQQRKPRAEEIRSGHLPPTLHTYARTLFTTDEADVDIRPSGDVIFSPLTAQPL